MEQPQADRRATYLAALTLEIQKKLQKALNMPVQRPRLLEVLFADVALEVKDEAREIILNKEEDEITKTEQSLCFYDLLADYYVQAPQAGNSIVDLIVQLWSQYFVSHIFALLFHKWLFEVSVENTEVLLRYASALVQGSSNIFWIDIQTNRRRFLSLFRVAIVPHERNKIAVQARRDLYLLLSRFLFFYNLDDDMLETFIKHFPAFPNAFLIGGPADVFVIEVTDQLQKLKVEPVVLHYISRMSTLQGLELRMTTSTRLKACLYSFTSPGGPMYPTRAVRHAAWETLDLLFPVTNLVFIIVGRYPRHVISLFFRLLYPWCWPSSCWNFIKTCIRAFFCYFINKIIASWEKMRRPNTKSS
ncbi:hypothetical protein ZIOFF_005110 [Zingiber officinale]|uniref:K-stimulated pyrophosphate-energized sodium pump protein n=1 Tax=Zingiber officinale TaxID=94328 RepID=A0A8J5HVR5_ZINOF|nr:hypothetical protein ZIOFF_005110 [Zingiber officinale]